MIIPYIAKSAVDAAEISELFDSAAIPFHPIAVVNWPKEFPYTPGVKFRIAHNGSMILIEYVVAEEYVRAMAESDNGHVWEDSCVEMFITFDGSHYYNIECNCLRPRKKRPHILYSGAGSADTALPFDCRCEAV